MRVLHWVWRWHGAHCPAPGSKGVAVTGIDLSPHKLEQLAAKPGSEQITTVLGDFATTSVPDRFDVVYLVFHTLMNLITQARQVACFANAATHLKPGGYFVVEVMLPRLAAVMVGETTQLFACSDEHIGIDEYDLASQSLVSHHVHWRDGVATSTSLPCRYVWPNLISWPNWPAFICMSGAQAGRARPLRVRVRLTYLYGSETERWARSTTRQT